jgi:hypothetical protein
VQQAEFLRFVLRHSTETPEMIMKLKHLALAVALLGASFAQPVLAQEAPPPGQPMMHQPGNDHRKQIRIGIHKIEAAYDHLASAGDDWGGHRAAAMQNLQAAKHELEVALQFEEQQLHH